MKERIKKVFFTLLGWKGRNNETIHSPLDDDTKKLLDIYAFEKMRSKAVIVNTARAEL
ncbi:NAD(P)-dependent oxidoreductase [Anaerotignum propionicum]|uniref:NAD(P)-dependent oxidoreductase n=1 Tax=Anaerotignum propionicum TaxID=28446 RepID=UPI003B514219